MSAFSSWLVEQVAERTKSDHILDQFGAIQSEQDGRFILTGKGRTPYDGYMNALAAKLKERQFYGYGFHEPTDGSLENIQLLSYPGNEAALAFAQKDAVVYAQNTLGMTHFTILKELPQATECAVTVSQTFASYADLEKAAEDAASTPTREDTIRIGLPPQFTGSFVTTGVLADPLKKDGYEFVPFDTLDAMVEAAAKGEIDMACVVQFPGLVDYELVGALKAIVEKKLPIMRMDTQSFETHFQNHEAGYRRVDTFIPVRVSWDRVSSYPNILKQDIDLPPLLAITPVLIGRNLGSVSDPNVWNFIRKLHAEISRMQASDMIPRPGLDSVEVSPEKADVPGTELKRMPQDGIRPVLVP
jgi:hypothetical protein